MTDEQRKSLDQLRPLFGDKFVGVLGDMWAHQDERPPEPEEPTREELRAEVEATPLSELWVEVGGERSRFEAVPAGEPTRLGLEIIARHNRIVSRQSGERADKAEARVAELEAEVERLSQSRDAYRNNAKRARKKVATYQTLHIGQDALRSENATLTEALAGVRHKRDEYKTQRDMRYLMWAKNEGTLYEIKRDSVVVPRKVHEAMEKLCVDAASHTMRIAEPLPWHDMVGPAHTRLEVLACNYRAALAEQEGDADAG